MGVGNYYSSRTCHTCTNRKLDLRYKVCRDCAGESDKPNYMGRSMKRVNNLLTVSTEISRSRLVGCAAKLMQIRFNYLAAGHTEEEWKTYISERLRRACVESIKEVTQVAKPREESRETNGYSGDEV